MQRAKVSVKYFIVSTILFLTLMASFLVRKRTLRRRKNVLRKFDSIPIKDVVDLFDKDGKYPNETQRALIEVAKYFHVDVGRFRPHVLVYEIVKGDSPFDDDILEMELILYKNGVRNFNDIDISGLVELLRQSRN